MQQLYAYVAKKYTLNFTNIDSFRACIQSFVSCRFYPRRLAWQPASAGRVKKCSLEYILQDRNGLELP